MGKLREAFNNARLSDTPVDEPIPDTWEDADSVTYSDVARQINDRGQPPPNILTPFQKKVAFMAPQPSDQFSTATFFLIGGANPICIANALDPGVSCRVTVWNYGDGTNPVNVLLAPAVEVLRPAVDNAGQAMAIKLPSLVNVIPAPLVIATSAPIYAICVAAAIRTAEVAVLVESYNPDQYSWDTWEVGHSE